MSKRTVLVTALLVLLTGLWAPAADAQIGTVDVSVSKLSFRFAPLVNATGNAVLALINTTGPATVQINYAYGDGAGINEDDQTPAGSTLIRAFETAGSHEVSFTYEPSFARRGPQRLVVQAVVQGQVDQDASNNSLAVDFVVRHPKLNLTFEEPATLEVVPLGEAHLRFFVRNDGNVVDNVTPELRLDPGPWEAYPYGPLPPIAPGASATGIVVLRSTSATDRTNLSLNLTARSEVGGEGNVVLQAPLLRTNDTLYARRPTVAIEALPLQTQIFPGEARNVTFTLRNAGDMDAIFRVTPSILHAPEGWNATMAIPDTWPANLTRPAAFNFTFPVALRPGENVTLQANVTRALATPNATATLRLEVNSTNGDRIALLAGGSYRDVETSLLTDAGPDLIVTLEGSPSLLYQGDAPLFTLSARNVGRGNASNATLHLELRDNLRAVESVVLRVPALGPGNASTHTWSPSTSGLKGAYVLLARIDANASDVDRNLDNNTLRKEMQVRAPALALHAPETVRAVPGGRLLFTSATGGVSVSNLGAQEETILVTLTSPVEWLRAEWRVTAAPGSVHPIPLQLEVPAFPGVQRASGTLTAVVEARPRFSDTATLDVELDDADPPVLTLVSPAGPTRVGEPTRIAVRALDSSGIGRAEVVLAQPGGERVALPLQRDASDADVYAVTHTPQAPGLHRLEFRVRDASGEAHAEATLNATWTVEGSGYLGLKPVNFGEGAHVGKVPLRFAEVQAGTTRSVLVDIGEGLRALAPPYGVALPEKEGPVVVKLRATALDGSEWRGQWNVTVDLTPPPVEDALSKDAGAGRVDLTVRAPGATSVVARFQTGTGPVEVGLNARGGGLFGATVTAPGAWDAVTFVAQDEAGNVGSSTLQAPKDETPAPAAALLLAVLAALALALRRRRR